MEENSDQLPEVQKLLDLQELVTEELLRGLSLLRSVHAIDFVPRSALPKLAAYSHAAC